MRVIVPETALQLAYTGTPSYVFPSWSASSVTYIPKTRVKYQVGSVWYDYQCRFYHTSSADRTPTNPTYWDYIGPSVIASGVTHTTNVALSLYATWLLSTAYSRGNILFCLGDYSDYQVIISTGIPVGNTWRACEQDHYNPGANTYVSLRGKGNAWACFDSGSSNPLVGRTSAGALVDPVTFTFLFTATDTVDCCFLSGMKNVEDLSVAITYGGSLQETLTSDQEPSETHYGSMNAQAILDLATPIAAGTAVSVAVTLNAYDASQQIELGQVGFGKEFVLADTEWGIETGVLSFSQITRDETTGYTKFARLGSASTLSATCMVKAAGCSGATSSGDIVMRVLRSLEGKPLMMDFNNPASGYDRLKVFGFFNKVASGLHSLSHETLTMEVQSLA